MPERSETYSRGFRGKRTMTWMRLPEEYSGKESGFVILPVKYEKDLTYGGGTKRGPEEIIKASEHLEYYDEQYDAEAFIEGIFTMDPVSGKNAEEMIDNIKAVYPKNKFVIGLGGDHACTIGFVRAIEEEHQEFSVLLLDAHSDFRDSWNNSPLNHACISKEISKKHDIGIIGVRSQDIDEAIMIKKNPGVHMIKAYDFNEEKLKGLLSTLKKKVYVSIDVDVFDPSFIRNTGTPEPGGLTWNEVIKILEETFKQKEVIGADIVEFSPEENYRAEAYSLAKLAYKIMAMKKRF